MFVHTALRRRTSWVAAGLVVVATGAAIPQSSSAPAPPFRAAVEAHLAAIAARDMEALLPTITGAKELTMIAPNGYKFDTRQQYVDFHRQWFATKDDGKLDFEIVRLVESPALGHALVRYRYSSKDETGKARTIVSWLALTFALEGGGWRLVFDQNTLIDAAAAQ
ncbi:MAG: nuclear transport factor 2 family protein [Gemmatimonadota bacterium]|nr:nuclear transport factor 2 family protein [Gemmatimonadota bacterium]